MLEGWEAKEHIPAFRTQITVFSQDRYCLVDSIESFPASWLPGIQAARRGRAYRVSTVT
jgi:hypothetical protein